MEVGLSTASFYPEYMTEEAVRYFKFMGVKTAEVFLGSYSEYEEDYCKRLRCELDTYDVKTFSIHALGTQFEPQLFSQAQRQRRDAMHMFEKVLKCGRILGTKAYVFHGPPVRKGAVHKLDFNSIARITDELAGLCGEYGILFTWENVYYCWYDEPVFASRIQEYCKSQNLYFTLDIKQAMKSPGGDPFDFLDKMGDRLANVHLCDFNNEGTLLLPGQGSFSFDRLFGSLKQADYQGPVMMEVYRNNYTDHTQMREGLDYLRGVFSSLLHKRMV